MAKLLMSQVKTKEDLTLEKIQDAVRYGNASGALCVQKPGGIPALPSKEGIETFLQEHNN